MKIRDKGAGEQQAERGKKGEQINCISIMRMMALVFCGGGPCLWVIADQRQLIGAAYGVFSELERLLKKKKFKQDVIQTLPNNTDSDKRLRWISSSSAA